MHRFTSALIALLFLSVPACDSGKEVDPAEAEAKRKKTLEDAQARLRNHKLADAERLFGLVLEDQPQNADALAGMGIVRYRQENYEDAEKLLTQAIGLEGGIAPHHAILAELYAITDRHDQAVASYTKAHELDPENGDYGLALGRQLVETEQFAKAEEVLTQVAEVDPKAIDPNGVGVYTALGDAQRGQDKLDDALRTYMKAQTTYGSDKLAFAGAALVYEKQGDIKHALDQWSAYIQRDCCSKYSKTVAQKKIMELKAAPSEPTADAGDEATVEDEGEEDKAG